MLLSYDPLKVDLREMIYALVAQSGTHRLRRQVVIGANAGFRKALSTSPRAAPLSLT